VGILLVGATTAEGGTIDVRIDAGRIAAVGALDRLPDDEVHDLTGYVLLPAPAEPHAHLDKALTADRVVNRTGTSSARSRRGTLPGPPSPRGHHPAPAALRSPVSRTG
jgi:cytosine/adenosine deaminase-related metal-dependent hydrolase